MNIGFIDYYLDEWHANNYPRMIREQTNSQLIVTHAYAAINSPLPNGRTTAQWCQDMQIQPCGAIQELISCTDALIVLSPDNCEQHEQLCQLPLRSGKRTYVDKTFAPDYATARRIFDIAESTGTPCYSTSALRFASEYQTLANADVQAISSWGPGTFETYSIHQLEPIMMLMQREPKRVLALSQPGYASLTIEFEYGALATLNCLEAGSPFMMNLCMAGGNNVLNIESDYFGGFIAALCDFFRTGEIPAAHADTLRIMAVRGAGIDAFQNPGTWVAVE